MLSSKILSVLFLNQKSYLVILNQFYSDINYRANKPNYFQFELLINEDCDKIFISKRRYK